ncbi:MULTISPECIES: SDR family oxidoreductase [Paraburkholderia]|uniref:SDR family oxidoreductase n=1 Tax=Paraburkholderia TaxID=1822464 RepID=UPI0022543667|nr:MULTISPECIES: SDR family oxidoreductase [Paraburkholderia]MCX4163958.1 SDR family oxidoreductase [Paraburkholderia megapolitana]MDN7159453.1 SDR family oxidoreductase [Paraburkholderia sp. CHISQ3]MDQ6496500.1 SDR family oxidoreductase [Paraburkholderia megapolitana]
MSTPLKVFITGASSGIGLALAAEYARRGAILGLVARRGDALAAFQQAHPQTSVSIYPADVRDAEALASAAQQFIDQHGCPDVVIANAGISRGAVSGRGDLRTFREVMDINYYGMVATFEPFAAAMSAARTGTLVGVASVAGVRGLPGSSAYSASKAAAMKYLEALRVEMRPRGVAVVTIAPGFIRTPMTDHNPYRMPFLMDADRFARKVADAVARKVSFAVFPWQMRVVAMLLHVTPRWLYDRAFEKAPHKPRAED